jgi:hypothetical protein
MNAVGHALTAIVLAVFAQGFPPPPPPPPPPPMIQRDGPAPPQVGTARLTGVIVANDEAAKPIRRAIMLLSGGGLVIARQTTTDEDGRFAFSALPAGRYTIQAWRSGFVRDMYGNKRPGVGSGSAIIVGDGQRVDITMKMTRAAAITGTILSSAVAPTTSMFIQALRYQTVGGERRLVVAQGGVSPSGGLSGQVDDRGVYRIYGLAPGEYAISTQVFSAGEIRPVTPAEVEWAALQFRPIAPGSIPSAQPTPARPLGYAPVYYPGTTNRAAAEMITVSAGEERRGVDFALQLVPVAKIEGTIAGPGGQLPQNAQATLVGSGVNATTGVGSTSVRSTPDGKFTVSGVAPGRYTLMVRGVSPGGGAPAGGASRGGGPAGPVLWGSLDLDVDGRDLTGLVVVLQPGTTVSGRVVFEGTPPQTMQGAARVSLNQMQQTMQSMMMGSSSAMLAADGTFTIANVLPGLFRMSAFYSAPSTTATWAVKSAVIEGRDLLDDPLEIRPGQSVGGVVVTFTERPTRIVGRLVDAANQPTSEYFLLFFAAERRFWTPGSRRVVQARPDNTGAYYLAALPPGEYYVCAVTDLDANEMYEAAFLEPLMPGAIKITLAEGEQKIHDMKLVGKAPSPSRR